MSDWIVCDGAHWTFVMKKGWELGEKLMGVVVDRRSKSPPCRRKRDKSGALSGVEMSERVGQPPPAPERPVFDSTS
jgi:hypothetical protein